MRILIIESLERNQALIRNLLQPLGSDIDAVYSIEDGTHYIASGIYDIIVYGWTVPQSSWIETEDHSVAIVEEEVDSNLSQITLQDVRQDLLPWIEQHIHHQARKVIGDITIDLSTRRIMTSSQSNSVTPNELQLLLLLANSEEPVSKETIEQELFQGNHSSNQVEVYISYLRRKLKNLEANVRIKTIRRQGYLLETSL